MEACFGLANGIRTELFTDTLYSLKDMGKSESLTFCANHRGCGTCLLMRSRSSPGRDCPPLFTVRASEGCPMTRLPTEPLWPCIFPYTCMRACLAPQCLFLIPSSSIGSTQNPILCPPPLYPHPRHLPPPTFPLSAFHCHQEDTSLTNDDRADSYPSSRR